MSEQTEILGACPNAPTAVAGTPEDPLPVGAARRGAGRFGGTLPQPISARSLAILAALPDWRRWLFSRLSRLSLLSPLSLLSLLSPLSLFSLLSLLSAISPAGAVAPTGDATKPWAVVTPPLVEAQPFAFRGADVAQRPLPSGNLETASIHLAEQFAWWETASGSTDTSRDDRPGSPPTAHPTAPPTAPPAVPPTAPPTAPAQGRSKPENSWAVARVLEAPHRIYVHLQQIRDGAPVLGARTTCVYTADGELLEVKGRSFPDDLPARDRHQIPLESGRIAALAGTGGNPGQTEWTLESREWIVEREGGTARLVPILRYQFVIDSAGEAIEAWVDAITGRLLSRESLARHIDGAVEAWIEPVTAGDELVRLPLASARVTLRADGSPSVDTQVTGAGGNFSFESATSTPYILRSELAGPRIRIRDADLDYDTPADSVTILGGTASGFLWDDSSAGPSARDAFYHANLAYSFARGLDSGDALSRLDEGIDVRVDDPRGNCNAYWDGIGLTFYAAGGLCVATGRISDVVYHEYGHAVTTEVYRPFRAPRDMDEAFSDYFAATITSDPRIGRGLFGQADTYLREIETDRVWPQDANPVSPHQQGLILAGALWDLRTEIGAQTADPLFHFARYALPESFDEFLLDLLTYDDDDGDLSNGTPHFSAVIRAFRAHGIGDYSVRIQAEDLPDVEEPGPTLQARARILSLLGLDPDELAFRYRVSPADPFASVPLTAGSVSREFFASIPAPPLGSTVEYYWSAMDTAGTSAVFPPGAPDNVLSFEVGPDLIAPELEHTPLEFLTQDQVDLFVEATIRDNSGRLAEVRLDYGLSGQVPLQRAPLESMGSDIYRTSVAVGPLPLGATLEYRLSAVDGSMAANTTTFPAAGTQTVEVRKGSTLGLEDSDGGLSGTGDWEWGTPQGVPPPPHGTRVWATRLDGNYTQSSSSSLTFGPIDVDPSAPRRLEFLHYHDFVDGIDGGQIRVSTNGTTWSTAVPAEGYGSVAVAAFLDRAFTGLTDGWEKVTVALDRFPGAEIWVRWEVRTAGGIQAPGWYVDNPQVVSAQARVAPHSFVAGTGQSEIVPLSWVAPRGVATDGAGFLGYRIYRAEGNDPFSETPWLTGLGSVQIADREVVNGQTYRYRLHAVYSGGESPGVEQTARPAAPVFGFPVAEMLFRLRGESRSDTTLVVENTGEGILEFNAYVAESGGSIDDVRIRAWLEDLGEEPVVVFEDSEASPGPDIATISVRRTPGVGGDRIDFEILGHHTWHDPLQDFGGLLLLDTDLDLGTWPGRSIFGWGEDLNLGWDVGVLFGKLAREQGGAADALIFRADQLDDLRPLEEVSFPEDSNRLSISIPLTDLGDPRAVDLSVIFATSRVSAPLDRAPDLPDLPWLKREPRKVRIRPGEARPFALEFDATELGNGSFEAQVFLTSNDPLVPQSVLPVRLEVSGVVPRDLDGRSFRSLDEGMEIGFGTPSGLTATAAVVERSEAGVNLWSVITQGPIDPGEGGRFLLLDRTARPGIPYDYRMRLLFEGLPGAYTFGPYPATYRPEAPPELSLGFASPNPFRGRVDLRLDVPIAGRARVEVFAADGRRLATLLDDTVEPGRYPVSWESSPGRGIYWARAEVSGLGFRVLRLVRIE